MSDDPIRPYIRKLWRSDIPGIGDHLLRLDRDSLRMRFSGLPSDSFLRGYANHIFDMNSVLYGAFPDGTLRGLGELRGIQAMSDQASEIALSVEKDWQGNNIGSRLFDRLVETAQNRLVRSVSVVFLTGNSRMRHITEKLRPGLDVSDGQVSARFDPPLPNSFSLGSEMMMDAASRFQRFVEFSAG